MQMIMRRNFTFKIIQRILLFLNKSRFMVIFIETKSRQLYNFSIFFLPCCFGKGNIWLKEIKLRHYLSIIVYKSQRKVTLKCIFANKGPSIVSNKIDEMPRHSHSPRRASPLALASGTMWRNVKKFQYYLQKTVTIFFLDVSLWLAHLKFLLFRNNNRMWHYLKYHRLKDPIRHYR